MIEGEWYDDHTWLTPGCVSKSYGQHSIGECAQSRRITFVGDSSVQGIYWALAKKLDGNFRSQGPVEDDLHYAHDKVELEYVWDPYLNGSQLFRYAQAYRNGEKDAPMLLVVGGGQWHAKNDDVQGFVSAVERIADAAAPVSGLVSAGSAAYSRADGLGDMLLFAPVQQPYGGSAAKQGAHGAMNEALWTRTASGGIDVLWSFAGMTDGRKDKYASDLLHPSDEVDAQRAEVLMSLRCNANAATKIFFPNTRTCCATWRGPNWVQGSFLLLGLGVLPALVVLDYFWPLFTADDRTLIRAFCAFMSAVSLQHITDRTHIFEQVQRLPLERPNLYSMLIAIILIGVMTVRRSKPPKASSTTQQPDQPFLPRDQTDEWKGWMQAFIITYHYNMAWRLDWFWEIIRLAVCSYLFLTGFGHTVFFLQKRDYSFRRFAAVMVRTNLLPVALAYVMRTRWLIYYYMPLSTFWFVAVYATLAIAPGWNERTPLLIGKIVTSAAVVQGFLRTSGLTDTVVRVFTLTFKMSFDARSFFQYRVQRDAYIVFVGMLVAIFYIWVKDVLASDRRQDPLSRFLRRTFPWLKSLAVWGSLAVFVGFWWTVHTRIQTQAEWGDLQPYITFIPILTFTILRNAHPTLRNFHSAAFAWLGRYSGEMYVMQDHLWLAGDQEAVLRTGFFHGDNTLRHDRWRDLLLITPLYLIACCVIGESTGVIATWFATESEPSVKIVVKRPPQEEVEMGLLASAEDAGNEDGLDEKETLPSSRFWNRIRGAMWPRKVRNRAVLVLLCLWFLNLVSGVTSCLWIGRC